jgi:hypothetical protein
MQYQVRQDSPLISKLSELGRFLEELDSIDENLDQIAAMVADTVEAENCLIQLLKKEEVNNELRRRVCGQHGRLPVSTGQPVTRTDDGSAGQVMAAHLPAEDSLGLAAPGYAPASPSTRLMSAPIPVGDRIAGTVYISLREDGCLPSPPDIDRLKLVCLFLGKSLQVIQLQKLLSSRYAQFALNQEGHQATSVLKDLANQEPVKLAKILAKTFYREMAKAGFGCDHIISAATEIITQLNASVTKHRDARTRAGDH